MLAMAIRLLAVMWVEPLTPIQNTTLPPSSCVMSVWWCLMSQTFTAVGYGLQRINPVFVEAERDRMVATPRLIQINVPGFTGDFSLLLSNNASTGGTCFGDSGGPNFLGDSNVVAGVTSFGINGNCAGTGGVFRMDRSWSLDWVSSFLRSAERSRWRILAGDRWRW
jgi:hypothetical protein